MATLRAPGESTSLRPLSHPTRLHAHDESGRTLVSYEWEHRSRSELHNEMVLKCACLAAKHSKCTPHSYSLSHDGSEVQKPILSLLQNMSIPEPYWCRVQPSHVAFRYTGERPWPTSLDPGEVFIERGHTPLEARRVTKQVSLPMRSFFNGWLVEYERGVESVWLMDLEDSPPVPLSSVDTLSSEGEHWEHRQLARQCGISHRG